MEKMKMGGRSCFITCGALGDTLMYICAVLTYFNITNNATHEHTYGIFVTYNNRFN